MTAATTDPQHDLIQQALVDIINTGVPGTTSLNTLLAASNVLLAAIRDKLGEGGDAKHTGAGGQVLTIGASSQRSTQLAAGLWRISGSGDIWFRQGGSTVAAVKNTAESTYLAAGAIETFQVDGTSDDYLAVIQDGSETGYVSLTLLEPA